MEKLVMNFHIIVQMNRQWGLVAEAIYERVGTTDDTVPGNQHWSSCSSYSVGAGTNTDSCRNVSTGTFGQFQDYLQCSQSHTTTTTV